MANLAIFGGVLGGISGPTSGGSGPRSVSDPYTIFVASDTHYGIENSDYQNPNTRMIAAMNALVGTAHPIDGIVPEPDAVFITGDCVHHATENTARFEANFALDGSGNAPWPSYLFNGNHDYQQVVNLILARHGSLDWGVKIGPVWFQAIREHWFSDVYPGTTPPTAAQINAVGTAMAGRPAGEPTVLMVHRTIGGYASEWEKTALTTITEDVASGETDIDVASTAGLSIGQYVLIDNEEIKITGIASLTLTVVRSASTTHTSGATVYRMDALDALHALALSKNTLCILMGHDHYDAHVTWRNYPVFRPGSVTMGGSDPSTPPYTTIYRESFNVIRIFDEGMNSALDVANYTFGFNYLRPLAGGTFEGTGWGPNVWNWTDRVHFRT